MVNVVFVAPFLLRATLQFIEGVASLPGVRLALLSQDPPEKLPPLLRDRIDVHQTIENCLHPRLLHEALVHMSAKLGPIYRILGTLEQIQVPLAQVRERMGIKGMWVDASKNFRDKARMKDVLRSNDIPCARHCLATTAHAAKNFPAKVGFPLVIKPQAGSGSRETFLVKDAVELEAHLKQSKPDDAHPLLIEEFIKGDEYTFDCMFVEGQMKWHSITRYFPNPLQALANPAAQWCVILPREVDHPAFDDIRAMATKAIRVLGLETGMAHLEWFRKENGSIAISEVAARPPGGQITSMHGFAHDFDIHEAWARLMVFGQLEQPRRHFAAGTVFLRGGQKGEVASVKGIAQIRKMFGPMIREIKLPQPGQPILGSYEGEGYIILRHPQTAAIERALELVVETVKITVQ